MKWNWRGGLDGGVKRIPSRTITIHRERHVIMRRVDAQGYPAHKVTIGRLIKRCKFLGYFAEAH